MNECIKIRSHMFESYILNRISCGEVGWEQIHSGTIEYHRYLIGLLFLVTVE